MLEMVIGFYLVTLMILWITRRKWVAQSEEKEPLWILVFSRSVICMILDILVIVYLGGVIDILMLSNADWIGQLHIANGQMFARGRCEYVDFKGSDHRPLISYFSPEKKKKARSFRYDRRLWDNVEVQRLVKDLRLGDERSYVQVQTSKVRRAII